MPWLTDLNLYLNQFLVFTLVLTRISGLMIAAPVYGSRSVPAQVRVFFAFALALLIMPTQWGVAVAVPHSLIAYLVVLAGEVVIGLTLGLGITILFSGIQLAGQIIAQLSGMALADVFNPGFDADVPMLSEILYLTTLAVYLIIGGHRLLLAGLLDTLSSLPPGTIGVPTSIAGVMTTLLADSFELGIRVAAPATAALLLATVVMGLISRTLPQLNVLAFGFGLNAMVTLGLMSVSLGGVVWVFQEQLQPAFETMFQAFGSG